MGLFGILKQYGSIEVVFDTVNSKGMKRMSKYMKQVGHADASMYFYVDKGTDMAREAGAELLTEDPYYAHTQAKKGCSLSRLPQCVLRICSTW